MWRCPISQKFKRQQVARTPQPGKKSAVLFVLLGMVSPQAGGAKGGSKLFVTRGFGNSRVPVHRLLNRRRICKLSALFFGLTVLLDCGCHLRPNFGPPGTIGMQRSRAWLHDPYPSDELGPVIVGGRPLGFDRPQAETRNLQEIRSSMISQPVSGPTPTPLPTILQSGGY
jgi:hypothetical protein